MRTRVLLVGLIMVAALVAATMGLAHVHRTGSVNLFNVARTDLLMLLDESHSMGQGGLGALFGRPTPWEEATRPLPGWLASLPPNVRVGLTGFGGDCGMQGALRLPVGTDRGRIASAVTAARPEGATPLNRTLEDAPSAFPADAERKVVLLVTDGVDTCTPEQNTCEVARRLHEEQHIDVYVASWTDDRRVRRTLECIAAAGGGRYRPLQGPGDWGVLGSILPAHPGRLLHFMLGLAALFAGSLALHRHALYVARWTPGRAGFWSGAVFCLGVAALYLNFLGSLLMSMMLGSIVSVPAAVLVLRPRRPPQRPTAASDPRLGTLYTLLFSLSLAGLTLAARPDGAHASPTPSHQAVTPTPPAMPASTVCTAAPVPSGNRAHIVAADASGSTRQFWTAMKSLVRCYVEAFVRPGDQFFLIVFSTDANGSARVVGQFTATGSGAADLVATMLDDLALQAPRDTRSYFRPVAELVARTIRTEVRYSPVVSYISDGRSDGPQDRAAGQIAFEDVPFLSLATRGLYQAPGMEGWMVAVQGGGGVDLKPLFTRPIGERASSPASSPQPDSALMPACLFRPALLVSADSIVRLRPSIIPWVHTGTGTIEVTLANECVSRFRRLALSLVGQGQRIELGDTVEMLLELRPRRVSLDVRTGRVSAPEMVLHATVVEDGRSMTYFPRGGAEVRLVRISYLAAWGWIVGGTAVLLLAAAILIGMALRRVSRRRREKPLVLHTLGAPAVLVHCGVPATVGGQGAKVELPDVPAGRILATVTWDGAPGRLRWSPEAPYRIKHADIDGGLAAHPLGQPVTVIGEEDDSYEFTIREGSVADALRPAPVPIADDFAFAAVPDRDSLDF